MNVKEQWIAKGFKQAYDTYSKFEKGYKIDISPFLNFVPIGCHQEVDILWVER